MIAIKDIKEMPKSCDECFLKGYDECLWLGKYTPDDDKRLDDCPLVEIVTCKDCGYYDEETEICGRNRTYKDETDFCSDGERRK